MIKAGVIGYGTMGRLHSQAFQELDGVELIAVADPQKERRARAKQDLGVTVFPKVQELLEARDLDLVDICVPTYLHLPVFKQILAAKKHIFCEKPLVRTEEEGQELMQLVQGYPSKIGVGHVVRFMPQYQGIRDSILNGEIGQAAVARTFRGGAQFPRGWRDWFSDFELSGGVILDLVIHDLDYLRWLFGEVKRVYAKSTRGRTSAKMEHALIILRFENDVIAHLEGSWANFCADFYTTLEIAGSKGLISYDSRKTIPLFKSGPKNKVAPEVAVPESPAQKSPYFLELADMVLAIKENKAPAVGVAEAWQSTRLALAALESARTGQVISLEGEGR